MGEHHPGIDPRSQSPAQDYYWRKIDFFESDNPHLTQEAKQLAINALHAEALVLHAAMQKGEENDAT